MEQLTLLDGTERVTINPITAVREREIVLSQLREQARRYYEYLGAARKSERVQIHNPQDAAEVVMYDLAALAREELWVMLLDTRNGVIKVERVYQASNNNSQVKIGEVFRPAIIENAASLIVFHNHPSGDPTPSPDDVSITRAIVQAGKLLDIDVLDHMIIGAGRFVSLKERGLGFS